jgi:hypothetical protein
MLVAQGEQELKVAVVLVHPQLEMVVLVQMEMVVLEDPHLMQGRADLLALPR